MRTSLVIAAHNEGDRLWQTVRACVEGCADLDCEILIADDASFDGSVERTLQRFPQARLVRNHERQGASPTKALGAAQARGDVLVFLDGHCNPEPGAIERLVEDVEALDGESVVTPAIPSLCTERWKNLPGQIGHGYRLGLEQLDCGWLPLDALRPVPFGLRRLYESPALIGCAFAVSRELYDKLWGFDRQMFAWGVEDLDFGLKCWLMGHSIVHDPEAVIGHRFRKSFDNFDVPAERVLVNQLRMARKQFAPGVWSEWLDRCRQRHQGRLAGHPEGLWARAWTLFEEHRASAEQERAYLQSRRTRDEFWYADRFGLSWPRLQSASASASVSVPAASQALQVEPSPSPSPPPTRRLVLLFGYWPPTDIGIENREGMLWEWRTLRENYKGSGYDVLAISPTFATLVGWRDAAKTIKFWGKGTGQLMVDYRDTSKDFWEIVQEKLPIAIMSFSAGRNNKTWEIEGAARNLALVAWRTSMPFFDDDGTPKTESWDPPYPGGSADDFSPYKGEGTIVGNPPDRTAAATTKRDSNLPMAAIKAALTTAFPNPPGNVLPVIDNTGNVGNFVSEYMAYHVAWYRDYINAKFPDEPSKKFLRAGHVHVGLQVKKDDAKIAVEKQLDELFKVLP